MPKTTFDPGLTQTFSGRISRTINEDGSFNVERVGVRLKDAGWFLYFMNLSWPAFLVQVPLIYLFIEFVFALAYYGIGVENLQGAGTGTPMEAFLTAFFFSVQTFTTVGYGHIAPIGLWTNAVAAVEAMSGILSLAVATGLIYGRFSRPTANLLFSRNALMAPFQNGEALMFRVANRRPNILVELHARLLMMTVESVNGELKRRYVQLPLERQEVYFLPLTWTLVHPIDEASPLWGKNAAELEDAQAEFLVLIRAFDDTFSQTVHGRRSYTAGEIKWRARFRPAFRASGEGNMVLDLALVDDHEPV